MSEPIISDVILGPAPTPLTFNGSTMTTGPAITLVGPTAIPTIPAGSIPQTVTLMNSLASPFATPITIVEGNTVEAAPLLFVDDPQP